jgi:hypothetical protein
MKSETRSEVAHDSLFTALKEKIFTFARTSDRTLTGTAGCSVVTVADVFGQQLL